MPSENIYHRYRNAYEDCVEFCDTCKNACDKYDDLAAIEINEIIKDDNIVLICDRCINYLPSVYTNTGKKTIIMVDITNNICCDNCTKKYEIHIPDFTVACGPIFSNGISKMSSIYDIDNRNDTYMQWKNETGYIKRMYEQEEREIYITYDNIKNANWIKYNG